MASTVRGRGLGISRSEMEASRLVFVFVQDAKPRRKVAVPVPDNYSWEQFIDKVKEKLKITGVGDIYLSASGHKVRSINQLQDIDELCVVEAATNTVLSNGAAHLDACVRTPASSGYDMQASSLDSAGSGPMGLRQQASERHKSSGISLGITGPVPLPPGITDEEDKYVRRAHPLKRTLQRLFPGLFAPGLPVTARDASGDGDTGITKLRRRRSRRSPYNLQNLLVVLAVMCCIMTMLYYLFRLQTPLVPAVHAPLPKLSDAQQPLAAVTGASGQQAAAQAAGKAAAAGVGGKTAAVTVGGPVAGATGVA